MLPGGGAMRKVTATSVAMTAESATAPTPIMAMWRCDMRPSLRTKIAAGEERKSRDKDQKTWRVTRA